MITKVSYQFHIVDIVDIVDVVITSILTMHVQIEIEASIQTYKFCTVKNVTTKRSNFAKFAALLPYGHKVLADSITVLQWVRIEFCSTLRGLRTVELTVKIPLSGSTCQKNLIFLLHKLQKLSSKGNHRNQIVLTIHKRNDEKRDETDIKQGRRKNGLFINNVFVYLDFDVAIRISPS